MVEALTVRRLGRQDAARYREIRLDGLERHPEAFSSAFETESAEPLSWFAQRLENLIVFGAFRGETLVGIVGFLAQTAPKRAHKGAVMGLYVRPEARRMGVAQRLLEAVIAYAQPRVGLLLLTVTNINDDARRLYRKFGFVEYGVEKNALRVGDRYYDDVLMTKELSEPG
jgi:ribosomal protein S18 acetylase RimI-like enzyme